MAHGAPDNYEVNPKPTTYRLDDMAELAVRLGSPVLFDRLGEVVLLDSFENGIEGWENEYVGDDSTFTLSSSKFKNGGFSSKLTAGSAAENYMNINRSIQILPEHKIGLEVSIAYDTVYAITHIYIYYYDGSNIYEARAKINTETNTLTIRKGDGKYQTISSNTKLYLGLSCFHTIKLIIDIENKKYHRIIINSNTFDLSDYNLYLVSAEIWELIAVGIKLETIGAELATAWIDDIIVTQNEE